MTPANVANRSLHDSHLTLTWWQPNRNCHCFSFLAHCCMYPVYLCKTIRDHMRCGEKCFTSLNSNITATHRSYGFFKNGKILNLPWSAISLDLNPIEHLWDGQRH